MTISAYTGLQGSGKSYEVVSEVVVDAVRAGRHIVTNLEGLNAEAIEAYILRKYKEERKANITVVSDEAVASPMFFYHETPDAAALIHDVMDDKRIEPGSVAMVPVEGTTTKSGDLVIVDEAWQFWGKRKPLSDPHQIFFRKHRHYVNELTGITSDLVLISQSIRDFHPDLRDVIDRTFRMRKLVELGMPNGYTVFQHEKASESSRTVLQKWVKRYNKEVFELYKSHTKRPGLELAVDKRRSFFAGSRIWWKGGLAIGALLFGSVYLYRFFHPTEESLAPTLSAGKKAKTKDESLASGDAVSGKGGGGDVGKGGAAPDPETVGGVKASDHWRQVGYFTKGGNFVIVLRSGEGVYRYVHEPGGFTIRGLELAANVDGKGVSPYTGGRAIQSVPGISK
jgi:zona occludens toxin